MTAPVRRIPNRLHEAVVKMAREQAGLPINLAPRQWPWIAQEKRP